MIRVILPDKELGIGFLHPTKYVSITPESPFGLTKVRFTHCEIFEIMPETTKLNSFGAKLLCEGVARCSLTDQFNKENGRKIALTRALAKLGLGKNDRTMVWSAYRARGNGKALTPLY